MPANDSLDGKIIESLSALQFVTLDTDQKVAQLGGITTAIAAGAVFMKSFPLYRLLLDRIKEELAKYLILTTLATTLFIGGTLGILGYTQMSPSPLSEEKPALIREPKEQNNKKTKMTNKKPGNTEQAETPEEESAVATFAEVGEGGSTSDMDTAQSQSTTNPTVITSKKSSSPSTQTPPQSQTPPQNGAVQLPVEPKTNPTNKAPICALKILSSSPFLVGTPIIFEATFSDSDGKISEVKWDLGDGSSLQHGPDINIVQHIYSAPGTYTVTLTVFDDNGATAQASNTLTITTINQPPIAKFSDNAPKKAHEPVTFHNKSYDPDGFIVEVKWDFGDGIESSEKSPTHIYASGGTYRVTLTVIDDRGATTSLAKNITIFKR